MIASENTLSNKMVNSNILLILNTGNLCVPFGLPLKRRPNSEMVSMIGYCTNKSAYVRYLPQYARELEPIDNLGSIPSTIMYCI